MAKSLKQVRNKLALSKLDGQRELLSTDLDISQLSFITRKLPGYRFDDVVTSGEVTRTIEGASTVTINVDDTHGNIRRSGRLARAVDIKVDGLWFRLVKVQKSGNEITMTFESREVAVLRTYNERRVIGWGKMRRARFAQILVQEVKEFNIPFICPDLQKKKISKDKKDKATDRDEGFGFQTNASARAQTLVGGLKVKGVPAVSEQLNNIEKVLDVGAGMLVERKLLVASVMTVIQESTAYNHPWGDVYKASDPLELRQKGSVGLFQQMPSWGTFEERMNPTTSARAFFEKAVDWHRTHSTKATYAELCQGVQISAHPNAYAQWREEAERFVTAYGVAGGDISRPNTDTAGANLMGEWEAEAAVDEFQFMRGRPKTLPGGRKGWEKETSWDCLVRLAEEVQWRCFEVSGSIYFTTEPHLFKSAPRAHLTESSDGVDWIDFDYDVAKRNSTVEIQARVDRWEAPPGTIVEISDMGPANGRWLVSEIRRSFFDPLATITCKKPRARLPEPKKEDLTGLWDNQYENPGGEFIPTPGFTQREGTSLKNAIGSGASDLVDAIFDIAVEAGGSGVYVGSDLRSLDKLPSGNYSDHAENNEWRAARDIGVKGINLLTGPPSPKLDKAAVAIGNALGKDWKLKEVIDAVNVDFHGYRVQVIWRTPAYGGHMGHIHVGVLDKNIPANRLGASVVRPG